MYYRIRAGNKNDSLYLSANTKGLSKQDYGLWKTQKAAQNVIETLKNAKSCRHLTKQAINSLVVEKVPDSRISRMTGETERTEEISLTIRDPEELISNSDLYKLVSDVSSFSEHSPEYEQQLQTVVRQEDEAIMDILHFIEMNEISDEMAVRYVSAIKEHRKKRREAKDGLYLLGTMQEFLEGGKKKQKKIDRYLKERSYRPRILQTDGGGDYA